MKHSHKHTNKRFKRTCSKRLTFKTYQLFKTWYMYIKAKFASLTIKYIHIYKYTTRQCDVIIAY